VLVAGEFTPNPKQKLAIEHAYGPMLVLAGAGTGKTTVLVERIAWLIKNEHARAEEILAITFTENAARELKQRVEKRLGRRAGISASTFHAYCHAILKRTGKNFHVLTPEDVYVFLRQRIHRLDLERFIKPADLGEFLHDLRSFFDRCHEELIEPEQFQGYVNSLRPELELPRNCKTRDVDVLGREEILVRWREIARVYSNAMRLVEEENLGTFGMQISRAVRLLQADHELLERERRRARFILIDEFQDCNSSNIILSELLAGDEKNIFAVGDPDQAIYRFRGASSAAFEDFQRRFPQTRGIALDENQRSRSNILHMAFAAIHPNPQVSSDGQNVNFERTLLESGRDRRDGEQGRLVFDEPVEVVLSISERQEAADIAEQILRLREQSKSRERYSMAVLYRSHLHRERVMEELAAREIPFLVKGMDILNTPVIRDLMALARIVADDSDVESLFRVCAFPQFEVVAEQLREKLTGAANKSPFKSILQSLESGKRVLSDLAAARSFVEQQKLRVSQTFAYLVRQFGFFQDDLAIAALLRFVNEWERKPFIRQNSLPVFLEYLDFFEEAGGSIPMLSEEQLVAAARNSPDAVQLMTIHGAKGLEFSHVWLLRSIVGSFPSYYRESLFEFPASLRSSVAMGEGKEIHEQEERRLFYVAITRARDRLTLHSRPGRGQDPTPPGFLRPLLHDKKLGTALQVRNSRQSASAEILGAPNSPVASWMLLPPAFMTADLALSANAVESYSTCPLKFKLERDWRIPGEVAAALQYGSAVHTVLKNYYDPRPNVPEQGLEEVIAAFRQEFAKAVIEDRLQRELYEQQGAKHLAELVQSCPRGSVDVVAAETAFQFRLGKLKIIGRIDRIDRVQGNLVKVIDYKTGSPQTQKDADASLQLSIYAMGAAEMGFVPQALVLFNLQGNQEVVTARTPAQLDQARQKIQEAAGGIAAQEFEPKPGLHCRWCDYQRLCPATEQRVLIPIKALVAGVKA
jgi:DNA helicase-2/ATP-dependent DNA helicase PcrA